jgi:hypothetical protein
MKEEKGKILIFKKPTEKIEIPLMLNLPPIFFKNFKKPEERED